MSLSKHNSPHQNVELSKSRKRPTSTRSTPIACRVCDKVFLDNVSLVLHFECHLQDQISIPWLHGRDLAFLKNCQNLSLNLPPFSSSVEQMEACRAVFPRMNKCLRPLSVSSAITPNPIPTDVSLVHIPVVNSMPPINSSFDARQSGQNLSKPFHSTMGLRRGTPSSTHPLMYSRVRARSFAHGLVHGSALVPPLQLQSVGHGHLSDYKIPRMKQLENPIPEVIVISDDEEDENKNADEIDLTLKL